MHFEYTKLNTFFEKLFTLSVQNCVNSLKIYIYRIYIIVYILWQIVYIECTQLKICEHLTYRIVYIFLKFYEYWIYIIVYIFWKLVHFEYIE